MSSGIRTRQPAGWETALDGRRVAVVDRLEAIAKHGSVEPPLSSSEAATVLGLLGELQVYGLEALVESLSTRSTK